MANIEVRGYCNKPGSFKDGQHGKFTLAEKVKGRNGAPDSRAYYNVVMFNQKAPEDGSYVTVKGRLNITTVEKEGKRYTNLDVIANDDGVEVAPPRGATGTSDKDPWDNG